jgi:hypothetical protein
VPALFALGWLAVWPLVFALLTGCQSGAQQDLVARELRMHEDQIYAMEDYITQYQQLVCKYRSENAELRRRLADDYYDGGQLPAPRQTPRAGSSPTGPSGGTSIEIRETPGPEGQQPPSREIEIDLPDVPPLEGSTFDESNAQEIVSAVHLEPKTMSSGEVASAAGKHRESFSTKKPGMARAQKFIDQSKSSLRLHGEVVARDLGGGPRLVVNVERVDELENSGAFDGEASLMLVAPDRPPSQQSLARWDFGPEDVRVAREDAGDERTLRFYLELPAETPIDQSTELWVRLVPHSGEKLLAHTNIDLALPGGFATSTESATNQMTADDLSVAALASDGATSTSARPSTNVLEGDWSIARPGQPAILPSAEEILTGGWRTSSEPITAVVQANAIARPGPPAVRQALHVENNIASRPAPTYKAPTWSPERSSNSAAGSDSTVEQSPAWSATR